MNHPWQKSMSGIGWAEKPYVYDTAMAVMVEVRFRPTMLKHPAGSRFSMAILVTCHKSQCGVLFTDSHYMFKASDGIGRFGAIHAPQTSKPLPRTQSKVCSIFRRQHLSGFLVPLERHHTHPSSSPSSLSSPQASAIPYPNSLVSSCQAHLSFV